MKIEVGQVLSLFLRFNNLGDLSDRKHPYLVVKIINDKTLEIAQIDSLKKKMWKAAFESNEVIYKNNPTETVIEEDSYMQKDNTIQIEYFDELINFRRQKDKLSEEKLKEVISEYNKYHQQHQIDENKQVYISKDELLRLNSQK